MTSLPSHHSDLPPTLPLVSVGGGADVCPGQLDWRALGWLQDGPWRVLVHYYRCLRCGQTLEVHGGRRVRVSSSHSRPRRATP